MEVIKVRNVQEALPIALRRLQEVGVDRESRNGPVRVFPTPVTTVYEEPLERVIFWDERDANPFFHFFEALWMLAGRNDVAFLTQFVKRMLSFSDDGKILHGAYGYRWRAHFGGDQLAAIIETLRINPDDRRCVLQMWDPRTDLGRQGKDFPCNTAAFFTRDAEGRLDMTVLNRSNDMVWGAYGANAVHFAFLQEFVAAGIGCPVGRYYQVSNNLHAYKDTLRQVEALADMVGLAEEDARCPYRSGEVGAYPLVQTPLGQWQEDLAVFLQDGPIIGLRDPFFRRVVTPLWMAHRAYKEGSGVERFDTAQEILQQCRATDWRLAGQQWLERRRSNYLRARDDGYNR